MRDERDDINIKRQGGVAAAGERLSLCSCAGLECVLIVSV